jgi:hypothetical protein
MVAIDALGEEAIELLTLRAHCISEPSPFHVQVLDFAKRCASISSEVFGANIASHITKSDELFAAGILSGLGDRLRDYVAVPRNKD